jgi:hypothetical protein
MFVIITIYDMKGTNEMWGFKILIFVFSSIFNAVFCVQSDNIMGY